MHLLHRSTNAVAHEKSQDNADCNCSCNQGNHDCICDSGQPLALFYAIQSVGFGGLTETRQNIATGVHIGLVVGLI